MNGVISSNSETKSDRAYCNKILSCHFLFELRMDEPSAIALKLVILNEFKSFSFHRTMVASLDPDTRTQLVMHPTLSGQSCSLYGITTNLLIIIGKKDLLKRLTFPIARGSKDGV